MTWPDASHLQAAALCLSVALVLGLAAPALIARLPEPQPDPDPEPAPRSEPDPQPEPAPQTGFGDPTQPPGEEQALPSGPEAVATAGGERALFSRTLPAAPPKQPYAEIAALPHLGLQVALWSAAIAGVLGLVLGWTGALLYLVPLAPVGVVLMIIDWRTTLLPTRILHPTYLGLAVLLPLAAWVDQDLDGLYRAAWGWLVVGGWFWVFWFLLNAWGFGDVRLARVLGPALGYLGWSQMLVGLALIVFVGAIGGLLLALVRGSLRARVPYGPAMLLGALLGALAGPWLARGLGY